MRQRAHFRYTWLLSMLALCTRAAVAAEPVPTQEPATDTEGTPAESTPEQEPVQASPQAPPKPVPQPPVELFSNVTPCVYCQVGPTPVEIRGLHWHNHWNRVGLREYVTIGALAGIIASVQLIPADEDEADWEGPILFDGALRDALMFESVSGRRTARNISDALLVGSIVQPMLIDNLLVSWLGRSSPDVAWQMSVINMQAYALTVALNTISKRLTSRQRPWGDRCDTGTEYDCDSTSRFESFYSGHAAFTATGAGLICAHHTQLELYKNPVLDTAACLTAVGITAGTGLLRVSSDNHWGSDVLMGHLMGYLSGYLLPTLLYYKEFRLTPETEHLPEAPQSAKVLVLPILSGNSLQLTASGLF